MERDKRTIFESSNAGGIMLFKDGEDLPLLNIAVKHDVERVWSKTRKAPEPEIIQNRT